MPTEDTQGISSYAKKKGSRHIRNNRHSQGNIHILEDKRRNSSQFTSSRN